MNNLQQYQEETLKKFDEKFVDKIIAVNGEFAYEELKYGESTSTEEMKEFFLSALKGQLEVVVEMAEEMKDGYNCRECGSEGYDCALSRLSTPLLEEIKRNDI